MNDEILPQDLSNHLLLEVFSPVVKQARQAAKLIVSLDRDLWQTVVDLFVRYENDISKLKRFVDNASKWIEVIVDIPSSIELIVNNLQDTHKASTAAHIFVIVLTRLHRENLGTLTFRTYCKIGLNINIRFFFQESDIVIEAIQQYPELIQKIESVQEAVAICLMFFLDLSSEDLQDVAVESSTVRDFT